ncbi:MAG: peptide ABC transporter substrate-binding protein [Opitutaceae bacterium]
MFGSSRRVLVAASAFLAAWSASIAANIGANDQPPVLRLSQRNEPADLDPATATLPDEFFIIRALAEGLVVPSTDGGAPLPAAAERWDISENGLVYTFFLRKDGRWSNREPVTAQDFVASYHRLLSPATAAPKADLFFAVKNAREFVAGKVTDFSAVGFRAVDDYTFVVTLERATPNFLLYVASGSWIPVNPRVVAKFGRAWTRPENHVGNGPFTLQEWRLRQHIRVVRNSLYHLERSRSTGGTPVPLLQQISFIAFDNGDAEERAYRAGQIDVTMAVPVTKLDLYARERSAELHRTALAETHYLAFNSQRAPLNDARVRRALALAIDRAAIVERVLRGGQHSAGRLVPPQLRPGNDAVNAQAWELRFDAATARSLLAAAGFPGGKNFPRLEITSWARPAVLEGVQEMWRQDLGIDVGVALREAKVHADSLQRGNFDIGFITQIPDVADSAAVLSDFATGAPGNYPHWSDSGFDALLLAASRAPTDLERGALLAQAEQRLIESAAIAPLYFNAKNWLMSRRVNGWREDALWTRDYTAVDLAK